MTTSMSTTIQFQLSLDASSFDGHFDPARDAVLVTGSTTSLGSWNINDALEMHLDTQAAAAAAATAVVTNGLPMQFEFTTSACVDALELTDLSQFAYKYLIVQKSSSSSSTRRHVFLKQVEYNWRRLCAPLTASDENANNSALGGLVLLNDKWPLAVASAPTSPKPGTNVISASATVAAVATAPSRIDRGWLMHNETEFQFHLFDNPCQIWPSFTAGSRPRPLYVEIVPWTTSGELRPLAPTDYLISYSSFNEHLVAIDKSDAFNACNDADIYTTFRIRTFENPSNMFFQFNVHECEDDEDGATRTLNNNKDDESSVGEPAVKKKATAVTSGFFKVSKALLDNSIVDVDISLLSKDNRIVGTLKTEVLLITSLRESTNSLVTKNYNYHFNRSCIAVGHRGMGKTFDAGTLPASTFVENTIASFREAHMRGAQMVEFDVVLTKDKVPVVYHDFVFCIDQVKKDTKMSPKKFISIAVNQLTYDEVKQNKIYSHKILKKERIEGDEEASLFTSQGMFPTLREMCDELDKKLGFNVEIKYPIDLEDGTHEVGHHIKWLNRNEYVDIILKELYECTKNDDTRCIIVSTFDPNLCSMLRMKQNKFPVLFLTNGITNKWKPYKDARCKNTQRSLNYAKTENLHGIVAHAEELTKNLHLTNILFSHTSKSANFFAYSWGDDLNEIESREKLIKSGINGVIYDRINESNRLDFV